jgi:iron complex outermembrane receptor protein
LPEFTFNVGATQTIPTAAGDVSLHMDYQHIGDQHYLGNTAAPEQPAVVQAEYALARQIDILPAHGLLNAQATLKLAQNGLELSIWGKNLTNTQYLTDHFDSYVSTGQTIGFIGAPRTYGGTVTYRF